ncbi:DNA replication and repair protein RecF [Gammaproteobacteria bacterium]|nr:DNA replication and repair protein RecF [Gammaproteobacteria bacterium]
MRLLSHKHSNFRGLLDSSYDLNDINLIVGDNGTGKTSLLESVYVSLLGTPLNSFSSAGIDLTRNASGSLIADSTLLNDRDQAYSQGFFLENQKKRLTSNGNKVSVREAFLETPVCLIDSNVDKISSESPDYRRRLVDRSVFHVEQKHAESYKKMQKAIKQRNKCIKNGEGESAVRSWDAVISNEGEKVTEHRGLFVKDLQGEIDALDKKILRKEIKLELRNGWGEGCLSEYLGRNTKRDMAARRTLGGPHRADLLISLDGKVAKEYSSKGEEKQMSLSISFGISRLIEKKTGARPILLIDELESGLDEAALERISEYIKSLKNQLLITTLEHHKIKEILDGKTIHPKQHNC